MKTFSTRVWLPADDHAQVSALSERLARARHATFQRLSRRQEPLAEVKRVIVAQFGLSSRQFNAVRYDVQQAVATWIGTQQFRRDSLVDHRAALAEKIQAEERQLKALRKSLARKLPSRPKPGPITPRARSFVQEPTLHQDQDLVRRARTRLHHWHRRLARLDAQIETITQALKGPPQVCFGGKRALTQATRQLNAAQWALTHPPGDRSLSGAKRAKLERQVTEARAAIQAWKEHRHDRFTCLGSKDEPAGNASATLDWESCTLRLALPPVPGETRLRRLTIPLGPSAFRRNGGLAILSAAVNQARKKSSSSDDADEGQSASPFDVSSPVARPPVTLSATALTWVFERDSEHDSEHDDRRDPQKGFAWTVRVTLEVPDAPIQTHRASVGIGVDVNADHLACVRVDRFGNLVETRTLPFPAARDGLSSGQIRALIEEQACHLSAWALHHRVPLVIEDLDFRRKKAALKLMGADYARMLSGLAYRKFQEALNARAAKDGVEVITVNPAYTSVIGRVKYQPLRPTLSIHHAAAWVIARRGLSFTERCVRHVALGDPARNQPRHLWRRWRTAKVCEPGVPQAVYDPKFCSLTTPEARSPASAWVRNTNLGSLEPVADRSGVVP